MTLGLVILSGFSVHQTVLSQVSELIYTLTYLFRVEIDCYELL